MRHEVHHPADGVGVDRVHPPERAAPDDLVHLAVMLAVTVLVADDGLDARGPHERADLERLVHRERNRLLVGDELRARRDPRSRISSSRT